MSDEMEERDGHLVLMGDVEGRKISCALDALDLIGNALVSEATVVIPVERLDPSFFDLTSGFAGELLQKFVNYRLRVVLLGDITRQMSQSEALKALVSESNRGTQAWFLPNVESLDARLAQAA